ncbi:MAG TPA: DUF3800 domain-containing protein [Caldisericia bacterium]|nr:DUF3800 domain-containing protein [Caldisericia bacterium]HPF49744.1 DUF3800 domain-containing protein [Caldisericia bacterium]HPI84306.1 DUF3800 domain-containing protein [Caldisericia bacterium]HPQ93733.1 DUF3800 domain-containing protein [Caldisericia bacterium]HRV74843.1 DUF3800 domain-containing protein [Caldisericia bacterium]
MSEYNIYSDESSTRSGQFMLIGGLWVEKQHTKELQDEILEVRKKHNWYNEFKWNKVSRMNHKAFLELIDVFYWTPCHFRCTAIDKDKLDHKRYNDNDEELGFYKFYSLLISMSMKPDTSYHLFMDHRTNKKKNRISDLKEHVNNFASWKFPYREETPQLLSVTAQDSKKNELIQLTDVILGALAYDLNGYTTSEHKLMMSNCLKNVTLKEFEGNRKIHVHKWNPKQ